VTDRPRRIYDIRRRDGRIDHVTVVDDVVTDASHGADWMIGKAWPGLDFGPYVDITLRECSDASA